MINLTKYKMFFYPVSSLNMFYKFYNWVHLHIPYTDVIPMMKGPLWSNSNCHWGLVCHSCKNKHHESYLASDWSISVNAGFWLVSQCQCWLLMGHNESFLLFTQRAERMGHIANKVGRSQIMFHGLLIFLSRSAQVSLNEEGLAWNYLLTQQEPI